MSEARPRRGGGEPRFGRIGVGPVSSPDRRRRRRGRRFRAQLAVTALGRRRLAPRVERPDDQLLGDRLRKTRPLEGRAADRRSRARPHGGSGWHARIPACPGPCRPSAAKRWRGDAGLPRHRVLVARTRDNRTRPRPGDHADGWRAALSSEGHRRTHSTPYLSDSPVGQRAVLQRLPMQRRRLGSARLRSRPLHGDRGRIDGNRRADSRTALRSGPWRRGGRGAARDHRPYHRDPAIRRMGERFRGSRRAFRAGAAYRGGHGRSSDRPQRDGRNARGSGARSRDADGRADTA